MSDTSSIGTSPDPLGPVEGEALLSTEQAARILNVHPSYLHKGRVRGGGIPFVKLGKIVRYRPSDLRAYIESQLRQNTSKAA